MKQLFAELGVDTTKLTHELRIFAAQLLYEMGVPLEVGLGQLMCGPADAEMHSTCIRAALSSSKHLWIGLLSTATAAST
jgi:hypothetical protein